jgi:hypothetical protein
MAIGGNSQQRGGLVIVIRGRLTFKDPNLSLNWASGSSKSSPQCLSADTPATMAKAKETSKARRILKGSKGVANEVKARE